MRWGERAHPQKYSKGVPAWEGYHVVAASSAHERQITRRESAACRSTQSGSASNVGQQNAHVNLLGDLLSLKRLGRLSAKLEPPQH